MSELEKVIERDHAKVPKAYVAKKHPETRDIIPGPMNPNEIATTLPNTTTKPLYLKPNKLPLTKRYAMNSSVHSKNCYLGQCFGCPKMFKRTKGQDRRT